MSAPFAVSIQHSGYPAGAQFLEIPDIMHDEPRSPQGVVEPRAAQPVQVHPESQLVDSNLLEHG